MKIEKIAQIRPAIACVLASLLGAAAIAACVGDDPAQSGGDGSDGGSDGATTGDGNSGGDGSTADSCASATTCGADTCVDLQSDPSHCGTCDNACKNSTGTPFACVKGTCGNKVVQVNAGQTQSCALLLDGTVWCWGGQSFGQTGVISADGTAVPTKVAGIVNATQVVGAAATVCAIDASGDVWCWGDNTFGETGQPVGSDPGCGGTCNPTPKKVALSEKAVQLSAALEAFCVRTQAGNAFCWGRNASNILNLGADANQKSSSPVKIGVFASDVVDLDLGYADYGHPGVHALACAVRANHTLWCWGSNSVYSELGHVAGAGTPADITCTGTVDAYPCNSTPQQILEIDAGAVSNATVARIRNKGGCLIRTDKSVWCWGSNSDGELGNGTISASSVPNPSIAIDGGIAQIEEADLTSFAIDTSGQVYGWGGDIGTGLLGFGTYKSDIVTATPEPGLTGIAQISAMEVHGVALKTDGTVLNWGSNGLAQLGHAPGTNTDSLCEPNDAGFCNPTPTPLLSVPWQ